MQAGRRREQAGGVRAAREPQQRRVRRCCAVCFSLAGPAETKMSHGQGWAASSGVEGTWFAARKPWESAEERANRSAGALGMRRGWVEDAEGTAGAVSAGAQWVLAVFIFRNNSASPTFS